MERLSGLDASFLYLETPSLHMHVSMVGVFDPSTVPGGYSFEKMRDQIGTRLAPLPVFRRRLVEVPLRLGHPYWVDDGCADLEYHIHRAALPTPGGPDELARFVGDLSGHQLDRSRPLWELHIVEGLDGGRVGLVAKFHHSTIDGVSAAELLAQLFDLVPDAATPEAMEVAAGGGEVPGQELVPAMSGLESEPEPDTVPSGVKLVARALGTTVTAPFGMARLAWRTGRSVLNVGRVRRTPQAKGALPLTTPRTSLNTAITPHRKVAFASVTLDDVKELKTALDATVNDVVLAICTGALRSYLQERGELPEDPLVATVPVSTHPSPGDRRGTNQLSAMFVSLPCGVSDPKERVEIIRAGTKGAKKEHSALGADVLIDWAEHAVANVFAPAAKAYTRLRLADRHRPIHSLLISNVPGPDFPLYLGGAELVSAYPLGPVMDGAGLNVTVMSYRGVLNWGLIACAETVPGLASIADAIPEALDELRSAAGLTPATPVG
jgi:diacylglycerol O-acyltransferase / wax synthase